MDVLGGGVDHLRRELEAIVTGGAKETADRVALLCAVRSQAALEEERRVLRTTGCSSPLSRPGSEDPSPKGGNGGDGGGAAAAAAAGSSRYATEAWVRGFFDDKLASLRLPAAPRLPDDLQPPDQVVGDYDCAGILRSAYSIKGKVHDALTVGRLPANAASSSSERPAPGEALRSSKCNLRSVVQMCSHIFQHGGAEAASAAGASAGAGRPAPSTAAPPPKPAAATKARQPLPPPTSSPPPPAGAPAAEAASEGKMNGRGKDTISKEVARVRSLVGRDACVVCVLGGTEFRGAESRALVEAIATRLGSSAALSEARATFVTGGMPGVQEAFAERCGDGSRLWHLLPEGQGSGFGRGTDVNAGADLEERKAIFGLVGDVYITVEGGPGVAQEARAAHARGAAVVPLRRTGGASGGLFDFPPGALERPPFASEEQWALLASNEASVDESAEAALAIVEACAAAAASKEESPRAAAANNSNLERQRAENEELSRALLELTAELQKHNIISGIPAELQAKAEGDAGSISPVSASGRRGAETEYWNIGD